MNTAISQKLSDVIDMRIDVDPKLNKPVVEIEFKFVRYRLVVDSIEQAERLIKLLGIAMEDKVPSPSEKPKMPRFYRGGA